MLSGKTSIYIDPVKSQEVDAPPPSEEEEKKQALSAHQAVLEEWDREEETEKKARHAKRTRLDRSTFGRFIGNFGKQQTNFALKLNKHMSNVDPLEIVGRVRETQLQVGCHI